MPDLLVAHPTQNETVTDPFTVIGAAWEPNEELALDSVTVSVDGAPVGPAHLTPIPHTMPPKYLFSEGNVSIPIDGALHPVTVTATGGDGKRSVTVQVRAARRPSVTIDFDTAPNGAPLADGADVGGAFASQGVTFSFENVNTGGPSIFARAAPAAPAAFSAPNIVSVFQNGGPEFNDKNGTAVATFAAPVSKVTIFAAPVRNSAGPNYPGAQIFLDAFDAAGGLIATASYPPTTAPGWGAWLPLTVTSAIPNIQQVKFGDRDTVLRVYAGAFDNFTFA